MIKIINAITNKKIEKEKEVLNCMISKMENPERILKQSQKVDKLINKVFK